MGMAASQARFLGLTARKTNVEYEGQQVNQQRTALGNQSANYYNQLLGMTVPVPPSVADYTKIVYSFNDGSLNNTLTSVIAQGNGLYNISYNCSYNDDFGIVPTSTHLITEISEGYLNDEMYTKFLDGTNGGCYTSAVASYDAAHYAHSFTHMLEAGTYTTSDGEKLTIYPYGSSSGLNSRWWSPGTASGGSDGDKNLMDQISAELAGTPIVQEIVDLLYEFMSDCQTTQPIDATKLLSDGSRGTNVSAARKNALATRAQTLVEKLRYTPGEYMIGKDYLRNLGEINDITRDPNTGEITAYTGNDDYLKTLTMENLQNVIKQEQMYILQLNEKYGHNTTWKVRYVQNTSSGEWEPFFYKTKDIEDAFYDDKTDVQHSKIQCYTFGCETKTNEIKNVPARLEQDTSGRFTQITINAGTDEITYKLTAETVTDQDKYDDAMNQYEYNKYLYEQSIREISAKIEITQAQDKNLELRLKQLDTEQNAISTEMDAVSKIIEKNTESTFKTFG